MLRIERRPEVTRKLFEIWEDGVQRFGPEQADRFQRQIDEAVTMLARFPELGSSIDVIHPGYRVYHRPHPIHLIYRFKETTLTVVSIFHGRENWKAQP